MPPPERWDAYCPIGNVIPGTKFIAFKVPLKEALLRTVEDKDRFSPTILMTQLGEQNLNLAGVIDLTYTWKYYDKEEFLDQSVGHKKVFTKGHEVPSDEVYKEFIEAVQFFDKDEHLIGVHCTHGVNRTGYLICRYMIEKLNMNPQEAINLFNTSRGHNMERENYISDLKGRKSGEHSWGISQECGNSNSTRSKKPRWRHHKEDHPNWRQRRPCHPPEQRDPFPSPSTSRFGEQGRLPDRSRRDFNPRFSFPHNPEHFRTHPSNNRDFQHYRNYSGHMNHPPRQGGRPFGDRQQEPWQDPARLHCNGYGNPQHQRSERHIRGQHWEQKGHHNDEWSFGWGQQQRFQRY